MILGEGGPDAKVLTLLGNDGLALRGICWKTSSSLSMHRSIMTMAGEDTSIEGVALVATMNPSLDGLRSSRFMEMVREAMQAEDLSEVERSVLVAALLSLVSTTVVHPSIGRADEWREGSVDMIAETRHLDGARILVIPERDKNVLLEHIDGRDADGDHKKGWLDADDRSRAVILVQSSVLLLAGTRHVMTEKDGLLMNPVTGDVTCSHDASSRNAVMRATGVLDVPLEMFNLHIAVVMAAAIRVVAKHTMQDRDTMMQIIVREVPMFDQQVYVKKLRLPSSAGHGGADQIARLTENVSSLQVFRTDTLARLAALETQGKEKKKKSMSG